MLHLAATLVTAEAQSAAFSKIMRFIFNYLKFNRHQNKVPLNRTERCFCVGLCA